MPSRWICLAIVTFWLTTTGWLVWKEVWPYCVPGQPPPFTIDLEEEAQPGNLHIRWAVTRNGRAAFTANTSVEYREKPDDSFALRLHLLPSTVNIENAAFGGLALLKEMNSIYRVSRRGELREASLEVIYVVGKNHKVEIKLEGVVQDGYFHARVESSVPILQNSALEPVPVSQHGTVLMPLHPVNRIDGLRRGQSWRMPMLNVLEASLGRGEPVVYLAAQVLRETKKLTVEDKEYDCLIVQYEGSDFQASTWVDEITGLVMRQEQTVAGDTWAMQRESRLGR